MPDTNSPEWALTLTVTPPNACYLSGSPIAQKPSRNIVFVLKREQNHQRQPDRMNEELDCWTVSHEHQHTIDNHEPKFSQLIFLRYINENSYIQLSTSAWTSDSAGRWLTNSTANWSRSCFGIPALKKLKNPSLCSEDNPRSRHGTLIFILILQAVSYRNNQSRKPSWAMRNSQISVWMVLPGIFIFRSTPLARSVQVSAWPGLIKSWPYIPWNGDHEYFKVHEKFIRTPEVVLNFFAFGVTSLQNHRQPQSPPRWQPSLITKAWWRNTIYLPSGFIREVIRHDVKS